MKSISLTAAALPVCMAVTLAGCGTVREARDEVTSQQPIARKAMAEPLVFADGPAVVERKGRMLTATAVTYQKNTGVWLRSVMVDVNAGSPTALSQIVAQFAAKGVNVTSDLPLDNVTFVGRVNRTDAESALRLVLGSSGLDYDVDDQRRIVTIKPISSRTWYINLGNRRSAFSTAGTQGTVGGNAPQSGGTDGPSGQGQQGNQSGQAGQTGGVAQNTGNTSGVQGTGTGQSNASGSQISSTSGSENLGNIGSSNNEDFWGSLSRELTSRLQVLVPVPKGAVNRGNAMAVGAPLPALPGLPMPAGLPTQLNPALQAPAMPTGQPGEGASAVADLYVSKKIGTFALNPETGAITVQAPHWVLSELDTYFTRTAKMFNTLVSFEGRLVLVSNGRNKKEAFDIQRFAQFASGRYGAIISNNGLGGVTVGFQPGTTIPTVSAGNQDVGGALLGIVSAKDGLQIFNDYLEEYTDTLIIQKPRLATTSGVPGTYSNFNRDYYTLVSQSATSGNTGAAVQATTTTLNPIDFGTELQVYPRFDIATGMMRTAIKLRSVVKEGEKPIQQQLTVGNGVQSVTQSIPLPRELKLGGEVLLRDGDLIIVGGQTEDSLQTNENGVPGPDGPIGGVLGTKRSTRSGGTYYFALKVTIREL
jgi:hypothetical protein